MYGMLKWSIASQLYIMGIIVISTGKSLASGFYALLKATENALADVYHLKAKYCECTLNYW